MANTLLPNYIDIDYNTIIARMKAILSKSDTFKDYNFEGANFTVLMELMAYLGDLNTFYTNALAKNLHSETADVYEVVHSLVRRQGHEPQGYKSGTVNIQITTTGTGATGPSITIPKWYNFKISDDNIRYTLTDADHSGIPITPDTTILQDDNVTYNYSYIIPLSQGEPIGPLSYDYEDIVDNRIYISNDSWDHNIDNDSIEVWVSTISSGLICYERITDEDGYQNPSPYTYTYKFDKYQRYYIQFTSTADIDQVDNAIKIILVKSDGVDGAIGANIGWTALSEPLTIPDILNTTSDVYITFSNGATGSIISAITNPEGSVGNSDPETIEELKLSGNANTYSQLRNVTPQDYRNHLIAHSSISNALAWGEKEETMGLNISGVNTDDYNRVYLSLIPNGWSSGSNDAINIDSLQWKSTGNSYVTGNLCINNGNYYKVTGISGTGLPTGVTGPSGTSLAITDGEVTWAYVTGTTLDVEFEDNSKTTASVQVPKFYNTDFKTTILHYLKPRKMIGVDELFVLPELVYFKYVIGLRVKRPYIWSVVKHDVETKLQYFFSNTYRVFGDIIDSDDIVTFIKDSSIESPTNTFSNVNGIQNLTIRNVVTYTPTLLLRDPLVYPDTVFDQNDLNDPDIQPVNEYPFYLNVGSTNNNNTIGYYDNFMKPIKLGFKQYPMLASDYCVYINEER